MQKMLFSGQPIYSRKAIGIVRIITGLLLVYHGWELADPAKMNEYAGWPALQKLPAPLLAAYLGKAAELLAGILLVLGWLTRIASILLAGSMIYICFFIGQGKVWYEDQHPFLLVLLAIIFFFSGPGKWSLDK